MTYLPRRQLKEEIEERSGAVCGRRKDGSDRESEKEWRMMGWLTEVVKEYGNKEKPAVK